MTQPLPIKRSAGLLFLSGRRLLLLRRSESSNNAGLWGLPGGRLDAAETAAEAAWREAAEEMTRVPTADVVGRCQLLRRRDRDRRQKQYDVFVCVAGKCARERYKPGLNGEHDRHQWVTLDWCLAHRELLHPVLAELLFDPNVLIALARQLQGVPGFNEHQHVDRGPSRIALRPAA